MPEKIACSEQKNSAVSYLGKRSDKRLKLRSKSLRTNTRSPELPGAKPVFYPVLQGICSLRLVRADCVVRHDLGYFTDYAFRRGDGGISSVFPGLCRCQFHRRLCRDRARPDLRDTGAFVSRGAHGEYGCLLKTRG